MSAGYDPDQRAAAQRAYLDQEIATFRQWIEHARQAGGMTSSASKARHATWRHLVPAAIPGRLGRGCGMSARVPAAISDSAVPLMSRYRWQGAGMRPVADSAFWLLAGRQRGRWRAGKRWIPWPGRLLRSDGPLRGFLELSAQPDAVPCARRRARQVLQDRGLDDIASDTELLVSELVTNALRATAVLKLDLPVRLRLVCDRDRVVICVWDGNPRPPVRVSAGEDAEGGRGLMLVEAIGDRWGWRADDRLGGKVVWCELSRQPRHRRRARA